MKAGYLTALLLGVTALGACANEREEIIAPAPPMGPGAIVGTVAADSNGDGIVDGYYTADGQFRAFEAPPCPQPAPPMPTPRGERG